jgi:hypothetical protein
MTTDGVYLTIIYYIFTLLTYALYIIVCPFPFSFWSVRCRLSFDIRLLVIHLGVRIIVLYTTFINISVISWRLISLVYETGVPGVNSVRFTSETV